MQEIKVLDHGFVRLVDSMGSDISVSRAARVSYDSPARPEDRKLINYLWENHHTTPFEAVTFTFEVKAPMFVLRQWHRHRMWSYNELSARYRELPEEFYVPDVKLIGRQSKDNKQMRDISLDIDEDELRDNQLVVDAMRKQNESAFERYKMLLVDEVPRELARSVLPLSTYSHMFATVNLLNLFKFIKLRAHLHAQYEIQVYANAMRELIRPIVPICLEAFERTENAEK